MSRSILGCIVVVFGVLVGGVGAQEVAEPARVTEEAANDALKTLASVKESLELVGEEVRVKQAELEASTVAEKDELVAELKVLNERYSKLQRDFDVIATGADAEEMSLEEAKPFDLKSELNELVEPLVGELKAATEQPRVIERLKGELEFDRARREKLEGAVENIRRLRAIAEQQGNPELVEVLQSTEDEWSRQLKQVSNRVDITTHQLTTMLAKRKPFFEAAKDALWGFFGTRGRNFLLAILAFVGVFAGLKYFYRLLERAVEKRGKKKKHFGTRLGHVVFLAMTVISSVGALLFVLYATGDWVLMGLALVVILGLGLAAKTGLPMFYEQGRLLLNLGDVREGERVLYAGLPWNVETLSFYTTLVNPMLTGGRVRLPLAQLPGMNSRPAEKNETWFPCAEGNWVVLSDGAYGKVVQQTPEHVQMILLGGSRKTYPTPDFLTAAPENLSGGFRVSSIFGIDYKHQKEAPREIAAMLQDSVEQGLTDLVGRENVVSVKAELASASASSLDYQLNCDFSGEVAAKWNVLQRAAQRLAVEACNEHGWEIPFTQVTLHQAGD